MTDNPLEMTPEREERIRRKAYLLWEADGGPHGRDQEFWERAEFLVRLEDDKGAGLQPNPLADDGASQSGVVEEAEIQDNLGEFPNRLTDQGERRTTPMTKTQRRRSVRGKS
jgi:Protein of unknown function (DUF2934)